MRWEWHHRCSATPTLHWSPTRSVCTRHSSAHHRCRRRGPVCHLQAQSCCGCFVRLEWHHRCSATPTLHWSPTRSVCTRHSSAHHRSRRRGPVCHLQAPSCCGNIVRLEWHHRCSATPTLHWSPTRSVCTRHSRACHRSRRRGPVCHLQAPSCCGQIVRLEWHHRCSATPTLHWSPTRSVCTRHSSAHHRCRRRGPVCHLQAPSCCGNIVRLEWHHRCSATPTLHWSPTRSVCTRHSSANHRSRRRGPVCHLQAQSCCGQIVRWEWHHRCSATPSSQTFLRCTTTAQGIVTSAQTSW